MRLVFDGPGAPRNARWYIADRTGRDHEFKYGDELPASLIDEADAAAAMAREDIPAIEAEIMQLVAELGTLSGEEYGSASVALAEAKDRLRRAEIAIEMAAYIRNTVFDNRDSLVRRGIVRSVPDEPQPTPRPKKAKPPQPETTAQPAEE